MMRVCGFVAEHNPLHRGHAYHISKSRVRADADRIIAVISSNFVQRGEPAIFDKFVRARMAVLSGVDLAIELPVVFSCAPAGTFADAAVDLLAACGATHISFGVEDAASPIADIARVLADEPDDYRRALRSELDGGASFAESQARALDRSVAGASSVMRCANASLGVMYMRRVLSRELSIEPVIIKREGARHDARGEAALGEFASASQIRAMIAEGRVDAALAQMPEACAEIARGEIEQGRAAIGYDRWWRLISCLMARAEASELEGLAEMSEGFHNRMARAAERASSWEEMIDLCSTRRYTRGRIARYAAHLALGLSRDDSRAFQSAGPQYARVLAANERGRAMLRDIARRGELSVVSRPSAPMNATSSRMMAYEHRATRIRENMTDAPRPRAEASSVPVML